MGLVSKITKALGSTEKRDIKTMSLREALTVLDKKTENQEAALEEEKDRLEYESFLVITELKRSIERLKEKHVEERRAKGSERAKDSFVSKALTLLEKLESRKTLEGLKTVINEIEHITPRQAIHLDFFFREEMSEISGHVKNIMEKLKRIEDIENTGLMKAKKEIVFLNERIRKLQDSAYSYEKEMELIDDQLIESDMKKTAALEEIKKLRVEGFEEDKNKVEKLRTEKHAHEQALTSELGPVVKMLKKFHHSAGSSDALLNLYIKNPSEAFMQDEHLSLKNYLASALRLISEDEPDFDRKRIEKAHDIIENISQLVELRKEIRRLESSIQFEKRKFADVWEPLIYKKKELEKGLENIIKEAAELESKKAHHKLEINRLNARVFELKRDISMKISSLLDFDVEVS